MISNPQQGMRVATSRLNSTAGMMITDRHLSVRKPGIIGVLGTWVQGHGGDVWFVYHDGSYEVGAYSLEELVPENERVQNVIVCIGPSPNTVVQNRLKQAYQTTQFLGYPPDEPIEEKHIPEIVTDVTSHNGTVLVLRNPVPASVLDLLLAQLRGVQVLVYEGNNDFMEVTLDLSYKGRRL